MNTSALKNKGESFKLFSTSNEEDNLVLYKLGNDASFVDITPEYSINDIGHNHKTIDYTAPDEDCIVVGIFNGYPLMFNVGRPVIRFVHYSGNTGEIIPITRIDTEGNVLETGNLIELGHGFYYHEPSDLGLSIYLINGEAHIMNVPYLGSAEGSLSGKILLQKDRWMLCAVPTEGKIYEDFVKKIEDKYGVVGSDIFKQFNAYPATNTQLGETLSFIPGVTSKLTKHNFPFIMEDENGEKEVLGFWIKTKNYPGEELVYDWSIV